MTKHTDTGRRTAVPDVAEIAGRLSEAQREAVIICGRPTPVHKRAGVLFQHGSKIQAQTWLRSTDLIERYMHGGYLAYRLTPIGQRVRSALVEEW